MGSPLSQNGGIVINDSPHDHINIVDNDKSSVKAVLDILASRLRAARQAKHLSQTALSQRVGIKQNTLAEYESTKTTSAPSLPTLVALARVLEVSTDYLLGLTDDPTPPTS